MRSLWARQHSVGASLVGAQLVGAPVAFPRLGPLHLSGTMPYSGANPGFQPSQPSQLRKWVVGFGSTSVSSSSSANLTTAPQTWFRPDRLVIPSGQSANFSVTDIKIGNRSQLLNVNSIPATMFDQTAVDSMVTFDTADPAVTITVSVTNNDTTASRSIAPAMIGASAY